MWVCVRERMCVCMCTRAHVHKCKCTRWPEALNPPEMALQVVMSYLM